MSIGLEQHGRRRRIHAARYADADLHNTGFLERTARKKRPRRPAVCELTQHRAPPVGDKSVNPGRDCGLYGFKLGIHSALVTGSDENKTTLKSVKNKKDLSEILINFSPKSKERGNIYKNATEEIDILICTDCISEGQNLQDCDYLINYDIHWNPVRIIQRFGRIDRIGSLNKRIQLVNFWPNLDLDAYINLERRVKNRMHMVNVSATGEENIIDKDQTMNDLDYRKQQLKELQDKVLDLEDIGNSISITDLTFNDFKIELMDYMKENKGALEKSPKGIYSIVDIPDDLSDEVEPGVIFLLKQVSGHDETPDRNPLSPYYIVYITDEEEVKFTY